MDLARNLVLTLLIILPLAVSAKGNTSSFPEISVLQQLLSQPDDQIDLGKVKLTVDQMIDPGLNVSIVENRLDTLLKSVQSMVTETVPMEKATDTHKMLALRTFLYDKGHWNQQQVFGYDFNDPFGQELHNKRLSSYLDTRKGNCVTMPTLFAILALSTAPLHLLVKFTDESGVTLNLETTSGAKPARDEYIQEQFQISEQALSNGTYLGQLSRKESAAVIASLVMDHAVEQGELLKALHLSELLLINYPKFAYAMVRRANVFYLILKKEITGKYPTLADIPVDLRRHYQYLNQENQRWFAEAEALGWREPKPEDEKRYLDSVKELD